MDLQSFKTKIDSIVKQYENRKDLSQVRVCIPIETIGSVGGTPCVDIKSVSMGFDWDDNKLMLYPTETLMKKDPDTLGKLREEFKQMSWTRYEIDNLQRENKRLLKRIKELEENK